jgi:hypothetical protein
MKTEEKDLLDIVRERRYKLIDSISVIIDQIVLVQMRIEHSLEMDINRDKECQELLGLFLKQIGLMVGYKEIKDN